MINLELLGKGRKGGKERGSEQVIGVGAEGSVPLETLGDTEEHAPLGVIYCE